MSGVRPSSDLSPSIKAAIFRSLGPFEDDTLDLSEDDDLLDPTLGYKAGEPKVRTPFKRKKLAIA